MVRASTLQSSTARSRSESLSLLALLKSLARTGNSTKLEPRRSRCAGERTMFDLILPAHGADQEP